MSSGHARSEKGGKKKEAAKKTWVPRKSFNAAWLWLPAVNSPQEGNSIIGWLELLALRMGLN